MLPTVLRANENLLTIAVRNTCFLFSSGYFLVSIGGWSFCVDCSHSNLTLNLIKYAIMYSGQAITVD